MQENEISNSETTGVNPPYKIIEEMGATMEDIRKIEQEAKEKIPFIQYDRHSGKLICTCGWTYRHKRLKVMNAAIAKHVGKYGHEFKESK